MATKDNTAAGKLKIQYYRSAIGFNQQQKLIAIAEAVVPRTYQPVVVFDPLP